MNTGQESPQSLYIDAYYKGFHIGVTKRDANAKIKPLIDDAVSAIEYMIEKNFLPSWNKQTSNEALGKIQPQTPVKTQPAASQATATTPSTEEHICPMHTMPMKGRIGKNDQIFYSHNRGVYPNLEWCQGKGFPDERSAGSTANTATAY